MVGSTLPFLTQQAATTVSIGGIDAKVFYAGGVPGAVAGLTQINAEIPAALSPSATLPVIVRIGSFASTLGVTVAVK